MIESIKKLIEKIIKKESFRYLFFGGLTTLISIIIYSVCILAGLSVAIANTISTIIAISFAFCVNKIWVFESRDLSAKTTRGELIRFIAGRGAAYVIETALLVLMVDVMNLHPILSKNFTQVVVIVLNYLVSKFLVFR